MFDQMKQMKQAMDIQNALKQEKITVERDGVKVVMNGAFEIEDISLNKDISVVENESIIKSCLIEANKKLQMKLMELAPKLKSKFGL